MITSREGRGVKGSGVAGLSSHSHYSSSDGEKMDYFYSAFLLKESFFGMINYLALTIIVKGLTFGAKKKA